ncbi:MAG: Gfo/Idh/MocA family oxidoreductase [Anaerolineae bacterium]|nr:Gfo/Idh/MocA family oxidoreductase [Anaerolineae bacterium]
MSETVRIGIIGAGGIARAAHIPGYRAQPDVEIAAICDVAPGKAAEAAAQFGIARAYDGYADMLAQETLDAVSVCTPNYAHCEATLAALAAGCHVLCEKPIAMNLAEGRQMVTAARAAGKVLQIGLHQRFEPETQVLKRFIDVGELGSIYYGEATALRRRGIPSWGVFTQKALQGGGALIDIGVHSLDRTLWLMGNPRPLTVLGATYDALGKTGDGGVASRWGAWDAAKFDVDDMGVALVRFDNGATLVLRATWAAHIENNLAETRILGTLGGATLSPLKVYRDVHQTMVDITPAWLPEVRAHTAEITHFIACVRGQAECLVVPEQVLDVQAVLDAIYESAKTGHEVRLD